MAPPGYCLDHDDSPEFTRISDLPKKLFHCQLYRGGTLHFQAQTAHAARLKTAFLRGNYRELDSGRAPGMGTEISCA
jgi:hypothetical protein